MTREGRTPAPHAGRVLEEGMHPSRDRRSRAAGRTYYAVFLQGGRPKEIMGSSSRKSDLVALIRKDMRKYGLSRSHYRIQKKKPW